jgi:hypothetical protein
LSGGIYRYLVPAQIKWKVPRQLKGTFHLPHNLLFSQTIALSVMLFSIFSSCLFSLRLSFSLPLFVTSIWRTKNWFTNNRGELAGITDRIVKEANKRSYNFYRPNI